MRCIAVTSGKGGTGKSCVAAYTGASLAGRGYKTLLLELGADAKSLDLIVGAAEQAVFDLGDVLCERCNIEKAIIPASIQPNLFLLPAPLTPPALDAKHCELLLKSLRGRFDFVIVDGVDFGLFPPALADVILQILTPDILSVRACAGQALALSQAGAKQIRMVINQVPARILPMHGMRDFDDVIDAVGVQLIAVVPASPKLQYSANNAQKLDADSLTCKVFDHLAGRLLGKRLPLLIR